MHSASCGGSILKTALNLSAGRRLMSNMHRPDGMRNGMKKSLLFFGNIRGNILHTKVVTNF